jgi:hypothetical protein
MIFWLFPRLYPIFVGSLFLLVALSAVVTVIYRAITSFLWWREQYLNRF